MADDDERPQSVILRQLLAKADQPTPDERRRIADVIHTARETGLLDVYGLDADTAIKIGSLIRIALRATNSDIERIRM